MHHIENIFMLAADDNADGTSKLLQIFCKLCVGFLALGDVRYHHHVEKRAALKKIVNSGDPAEAFEAAQKLQAIPKNANPIRLHNRCKLTGRPKGYIRQFGISRIQFREMASNGLIPGVKKASW